MDRKIGALTLRELMGFFLLIVLLLAGLLSSWYGGRQHREVSRQLDSSAWQALSGEWTAAREGAEDARQQWESSRQLWASLADHTPMEEIDALFGELTIYAAAGERTDFAHTCAALSRRMEAMANAQQLSWWNVL